MGQPIENEEQKVDEFSIDEENENENENENEEDD